MSLAILGLGTALPGDRIGQKEAQRVAESLCCESEEQATFIPSIYGGTGINTRHMCLARQVVTDILEGTQISGSPFLPTGVLGEKGPKTRQRMEIYETEAPILALRSSAAALADAGLLPTDITHLVTVSCTGFSAPGFDVTIINELGLHNTVERTHIGFMGCHGALNGLRVANAFASSDPKARVLICSVELCSLHYHYGWDPPKVIANALFADGSGAIVGAAHGPASNWRLTASGSCLIPEAADAMSWTVGDHGFGMTLSKKLPEVIATRLRPWLDNWLAKHGFSVDTVKSWAIHPGGPKILDAVVSTLKLPAQAAWASREVLAEFGNMSSATVLFILQRLRAAGSPLPCVSIGFGPGLNVEVALFE
ncbi:MAG TPA: type III polyketide synthase [Gemmataceae bacterium]|jgi:predicted naringenin-chalcone synthase|nr:type III polyketide synthase [Gemmataceae bacterium]